MTTADRLAAIRARLQLRVGRDIWVQEDPDNRLGLYIGDELLVEIDPHKAIELTNWMMDFLGWDRWGDD